MPLRIAVLGAGGRMGQAVLAAIADSDDAMLAGALVRPGSQHVGQPASADVAYTDQPVGALDSAEIVIDFTLPEAFNSNISACLEARCPLVVGTTGLSSAQSNRLREIGRELPVVWSPNMSVGVNLCFRLAQLAAGTLSTDYDAEILDVHHRYKRDIPSGTALQFGEQIAGARSQKLDDVMEFRTPGKHRQRHRGAVGMSAIRAGAEPGSHTVSFISESETVEIRHRAAHRGAYADGALRAARWLAGRPVGLYSMADVLGFPA
ncbi:MAG: 4-hydroxy-tetrahydrodipicolinate reductase [Gammaproteobacteria bacterium]|nr:4-hydroxy-tetrahydrodipicolinate reductase [Gammaproteobacteria bacterium]NNF61103.1 4-hydroxy-tetrahydrodipicolinate reductase [Gammaproteobacteria bacterium]